LRLHTLQDTISQPEIPHRRQTSHRSLRIAPVTKTTPVINTDINHRLLLGKTTKWEPIYLSTHYIHRYIPFGNQPDYSSIWSSTTTIHVPHSTFGGCFLFNAKRTWQPNYTGIDAKYHGSISCTSRIQFVFIVLCNIPQNY